MAHVISLWAPWMPDDKASAYVEHVWGLDIYQRTQAAREIGELLRLTNAERERLKLWPFAPIDLTDEQLAERRKVREATGEHENEERGESEPRKPTWQNWQPDPSPG